MTKIKELKPGQTYVVRLIDERNSDVLREYSRLDAIMCGIPRALIPVLKSIVVLSALLFPPVLIIVIPAILYKELR